MSRPPKPPGTGTCYYLSYASSWSFRNTAPYPHLPLCLATSSDTARWLICQYQRPKQTWQILQTFDPSDIDAYLSDNEENIRVLGWFNRGTEEGVGFYLDLKFLELDNLLDWCRMVLDIRVKWGSRLMLRQVIASQCALSGLKYSADNDMLSFEMKQLFQHPPQQRSNSTTSLPNSHQNVASWGALACKPSLTVTSCNATKFDAQLLSASKYADVFRTDMFWTSTPLEKGVERDLEVCELALPQVANTSRSYQSHRSSASQAPGVAEERLDNKISSDTPNKIGQPVQLPMYEEVVLTALPRTLAQNETAPCIPQSRKFWSQEWDSGTRPLKRRKRRKKLKNVALQNDETISITLSDQSIQSTRTINISKVNAKAKPAIEQQLSAAARENNGLVGIEPRRKDTPYPGKPPRDVLGFEEISGGLVSFQRRDASDHEVPVAQEHFHQGALLSLAPTVGHGVVVGLGDDLCPSTQPAASDVDAGDIGMVFNTSQDLSFRFESGKEPNQQFSLQQPHQSAAEAEAAAVGIIQKQEPSDACDMTPRWCNEREECRSSPKITGAKLLTQRLQGSPQSSLSASNPPDAQSPEGFPGSSRPARQCERSGLPKYTSNDTALSVSLHDMLDRVEVDPAMSSSSLLTALLEVFKTQQSMLLEMKAEVATLRDEVRDLGTRTGQLTEDRDRGASSQAERP